ncbi:protein of unknown function DUF72 [Pyrolobus fumarii 1A]|uniref:DUF72 domain-containing protein n=1 Tax=Pyrolobus fumarii (strain DSM 11204 / 1A) TaxID=694429 RepID=G0EF19_PYRF1|nr:DUF72 domain-containing protein [Pyrolobus fumarii]AEM38916.1 protein of unknown function DUF72 [Pyrolobus fumarii 1A]
MGTSCTVYVGTSGWVYDWNPDGLEWYASYSGLNAVELNASFYRIPSRRMVESWARKGAALRWAVKVYRGVTHVHRLNERGLQLLLKFLEVFKPMDTLIDFYLVQLPPGFRKTPENMRRVAEAVKTTGLGERIAVEFRHESWFDKSTVEWAEKLGFTLVSIDAPIGTWIVAPRGTLYLRMHGRGVWYAYDYSSDELMDIASRIAALAPRRTYVFFNNDHWMLDNARMMLRLLRDLLCRV